MENCDPPTPWHRLAHFCYAKHPPFPSSPLHNPPAPPPRSPQDTAQPFAPRRAQRGLWGPREGGGGRRGSAGHPPPQPPEVCRGASGGDGSVWVGGGGGASPNPPPGPHDRRSHRAPSGPWPCRGRSGASTMVKGGGGGLGGPVSTPPPLKWGGGGLLRGAAGGMDWGGGDAGQRCIGRGERTPYPPSPSTPSLCPATVFLTASARLSCGRR